MNVMSASPSPDADAMADPACYAAMLRELAGMGMDIARALHRQATAPDGAGAGAGDGPGEAASLRVEAVSRAFDRVARCVRRTILLARRLSEPMGAVSPDGRSVAGARRHIVRVLEDEIQRDVPDETQREALTAELHERLDGPDVADDALGRPVGDIIREIRRDLGLDTVPGPGRLGCNVFVRRTPADIAVLCARAMEGGAMEGGAVEGGAVTRGGGAPGRVALGGGPGVGAASLVGGRGSG